MEYKELIKHFESEHKPLVSAAAYLGLHPETVRAWKRTGVVPRQWAAVFQIKRNQSETTKMRIENEHIYI